MTDAADAARLSMDNQQTDGKFASSFLGANFAAARDRLAKIKDKFASVAEVAEAVAQYFVTPVRQGAAATPPASLPPPPFPPPAFLPSSPAAAPSGLLLTGPAAGAAPAWPPLAHKSPAPRALLPPPPPPTVYGAPLPAGGGGSGRAGKKGALSSPSGAPASKAARTTPYIALADGSPFHAVTSIGGVEVVRVGINGFSREVVNAYAGGCPVGLSVKGCCGYPPAMGDYERVRLAMCTKPGEPGHMRCLDDAHLAPAGTRVVDLVTHRFGAPPGGWSDLPAAPATPPSKRSGFRRLARN
jgi:hypothetical protein